MSEIDYEWMLRPLLAERGVHSYAELAPLLAAHGVQPVRVPGVAAVHRQARAAEPAHADGAVRDPRLHPQRSDQARRACAARHARGRPRRGGKGVGDLKPKRARIRPAKGQR